MIVEQHFEDYVIGSERTSFRRTITETDFVVHAGHTGDFFPHHMDAAWCATQDIGQRIAHGTLIFSVGIGLTATTPRITATRDHPKRATHGIVTEAVDIRNQRGETVLACEHLYLVLRRDPVG